MSNPQANGVPRNPLQPVVLWDGTLLYRCSEDDPDAIVETWPDGKGPRSEDAFPPKSDQVPETIGQELNALVNAMTAYKAQRGLQYLLWHDVLDVLHDMGYRKVAAPSAPQPAVTDSDEAR